MTKYLYLVAALIVLSGCTYTQRTSNEITVPPTPDGVPHTNEDVMDSGLTFEQEVQALEILQEFPDIRKWQIQFENELKISKNGGRAAYLVGEFNAQGEVQIKVYESLPGHNATLGHYCVNLETESVRECSLD